GARRGGQARGLRGQHPRPGERRGHAVRIGDGSRRGRGAEPRGTCDREASDRDARRAHQAARPLRRHRAIPRRRHGQRPAVGGAYVIRRPPRAIVLAILLAAWAPSALGAAASSSAKSSTKSGTKSATKAKAGSDSVLVRIGKETITTGQFQRR